MAKKRRRVCRKFGYTTKRRKGRKAHKVSGRGVRVQVKRFRGSKAWTVVKSGVKKFRLKRTGAMSSGMIFCGRYKDKKKAMKRAARVPKTTSFSCG